jgi:hypothetical protein
VSSATLHGLENVNGQTGKTPVIHDFTFGREDSRFSVLSIGSIGKLV